MPNATQTSLAVALLNSLFSRVLAPLDASVLQAAGARNCPVPDDLPWLVAGILRAIEPVASGRDFLQRFEFLLPAPLGDVGISRGHYFTGRRLRHVTETGRRLAAAMADPADAPIAGTAFDLVTNLADMPPGVVAQLYRMRRDIEKEKTCLDTALAALRRADASP